MENEPQKQDSLNVYQVGSELGMSTNTVLRYIKDYSPYIPFEKEGRSYRFTTESFPVFRYIQKLLASKKAHDQVMARLSKKYPDIQLPETAVERMAAPKTTKGGRKRQGSTLPLLERVSVMETRLGEIEKSIQKLEKKLDQKENMPSEIKLELKRLKRLIEG